MEQFKYHDINENTQNMIYPIYEGEEICQELITTLGHQINQVVDRGYQKLTKIYTLGKYPFDYILFVGLGSPQTFTTARLREVVQRVSQEVKETVVLQLNHFVNDVIDIHTFTKVWIETWITAQYQEHQIGHDVKNIADCHVIAQIDVQEDMERGQIYGESINYARRLADTPSNLMTPQDLVEEAKQLAQDFPIECTILDKKALEDMQAGGILSVNLGSHIPAYMICLKYHHNGDKPYQAVIGKGITFDSGGYNLKGNSYGMKYDMCGGANVLGIMRILAATKAQANVYGLIPTTENLVNGKAYKPQDVITTLSGKTVEIVSTDAEGRLILCDAITYAQRLGACQIVDMATLTGACVAALGDVYTGVFANDDTYYEKFVTAMQTSDEKGWRLPLDQDYFAKLKSTSADFKNSMGKPGAGASIAANFLEAFVEKGVQWIHLDIAGTADQDGKGATGAMIRSVVELMQL